MRQCLAVCSILLKSTVLIPGRFRSRLPENGHLKKAGVNIGKRSDRWVLERYVRGKARLNKNNQVIGEIELARNAAIVVLSTGAKGLGKSIMLEVDQNRYLFNAPDGLLRALYDANDGRPMPTTENIFFTSKTLDTVGGLTGFMLHNTVKLDIDLTMKLHGPPFVHSILHIMDYFSEKNEGRLSNIEWRGMPHDHYEDDQLTVEYVALYDRSSDPSIDQLNASCIGQSESNELYSDKQLSTQQTHVLSDFDSNVKNSNNEQKTRTRAKIFKGTDSVSSSRFNIDDILNINEADSYDRENINNSRESIEFDSLFEPVPSSSTTNRSELKTKLKDIDSLVKRTDTVGSSRLNIDDIFSINETDSYDTDSRSDLHKAYAPVENINNRLESIEFDSLFEPVPLGSTKNRHEIKTKLKGIDSLVKRTDTVGSSRININDILNINETDSYDADLRSNLHKAVAPVGNINNRRESTFDSLFETVPSSPVGKVVKRIDTSGSGSLNIDDILNINELDYVPDLRTDSHKPKAPVENIKNHQEWMNFYSLFESDPASSGSDNIGDRSEHLSENDLENVENYTEDYVLQLQKAKKMAMAYIVKLKHSINKVDAQKVYNLGEKSGPWVGDLVRGKSVTLSNGRVVTPQEVYSDSCVEVRPIVVLEVPSVGHLEDLLSSSKLEALQKSQGSPGAEVIVHMTPKGVMEHPKYKEFMGRYSCKHLILNEDSGMVNLRGAHAASAVNNEVHPELFPLARGFMDTHHSFVGSDESVAYGEFCLKYVLRPEHRRGYDRSFVPQLDPQNCIRSELKTAGYLVHLMEEKFQTRYTFPKKSFAQELKKFHDLLTSGKLDTPIFTAEYPKITFLGTGTAKPNLRRNNSGIMLEIRKNEYMILDPGEGTYRQMLMMFGHKETLRILAHLKAVFVSHLHFDHHGGIFTLMKCRREAVQKSGGVDKVFFLVPHKLQKWLKVFASQIIDISSDIIYVPHLVHNTNWRLHTNLDKVQKALNLNKYITVEVNHTNYSSGLILVHNDGWKLVYSGDTTPLYHGGFNKYGKDCDILIHEATNLPAEQELARHNCHSTVTEAIQVGKAMNAKYTLLTHFSGKMTNMPLLNESFTRDVGYAFDMMQVRPNQLHLLYHMKPVFESIYGISVSLANFQTIETIRRVRKVAVFSQGMEETIGDHDDFRFLEYLKTSSRDSDNWKKSNLKQRLENLEDKQKNGG
ncbi:ribonuclease Z, mitochondrial-like isoform X2 [Dreissena polymorpha]|uniref:ribonuclease Z, mitochondrial-like isoform X2 n=1 Tax=Dreissena polymorpha TaxID=45954 RepID=UPI0022650216|nr:ribonuclease Z, mitochondrial-like isoform X2 [Dreissena polymorpha]